MRAKISHLKTSTSNEFCRINKDKLGVDHGQHRELSGIQECGRNFRIGYQGVGLRQWRSESTMVREHWTKEAAGLSDSDSNGLLMNCIYSIDRKSC